MKAYVSNNMTFTGNATIGQASSNQPLIAWEDAIMWIGGYLSALKGKEITGEHIAEVLSKMAEADPNNYHRVAQGFQGGQTLQPADLGAWQIATGFTADNK